MGDDIVECIACHNFVLVIGTRCAEAGRVIVHPRYVAAEFKHASYKRNIFHIRNTVVAGIVEACYVARIKTVGSADTRESVDNGNTWLACASIAECEYFRGERHTAVIAGDNPV